MAGDCEIVGRMRGGSPDVLAVHDRGRDRLGVAWVLPDEAGGELLAEALGTLEHPALAKTLGLTRVEGRLALFTDPVPPRTLRDQVAEHGALPQSAGLQLGLRLAEALAVLHESGLVHGSLSADAVHVDGPEVLLADFRRARFDANVREDLAGLVDVLECALGGLSGPLIELGARCRGQGDAFGSARAVAGALLGAADALGPGDTWPSMPPVDRGTPPPVFFEREGDVLGNYVLQKLIGEGSMGRVFSARHQRLGRQVAIKVLRPEHAASKAIVQRFFQEARTVNEIDHEHIVQIVDFVEEALPDGRARAYCVMELLDGLSLTELSRRGPLGLERIVGIGLQLCRALAAAHRVGVVHRDVKPDNIMVCDRDGRDYVKVLDFGIAKLARPMGDLPTNTTLHGAIIGTPSYMSPEQAAGVEVDHRADLHAVGVVLYELLAGKVPFAATRFGALAAQIISQAPEKLPAVTARGEPLPRALAELVEKLLAKDPRARPASAEAVELALACALNGASPRRLWLRKGLALSGAVSLGLGLLALASPRPPAPAPLPVVVSAPLPAMVVPAPAPAATPAVAPAAAPTPAAAPKVELTAYPQPAATTPDPGRPREPAARHPRHARRVIVDPFAD